MLSISPFPLFHTHYSAGSRVTVRKSVIHEDEDEEDDDEERPSTRSAKAAKFSSSSSAAATTTDRAADVTAVGRPKRA